MSAAGGESAQARVVREQFVKGIARWTSGFEPGFQYVRDEMPFRCLVFWKEDEAREAAGIS